MAAKKKRKLPKEKPFEVWYRSDGEPADIFFWQAYSTPASAARGLKRALARGCRDARIFPVGVSPF